MKLPLALLIAISIPPGDARAAVELPSVFSDHMVLQRDAPVPVWGTAEPGRTVTVSFAGQAVTAKVGDKGRWRAELKPLAASANPRSLNVTSGEDGKKSVIRIHLSSHHPLKDLFTQVAACLSPP